MKELCYAMKEGSPQITREGNNAKVIFRERLYDDWIKWLIAELYCLSSSLFSPTAGFLSFIV